MRHVCLVQVYGNNPAASMLELWCKVTRRGTAGTYFASTFLPILAANVFYVATLIRGTYLYAPSAPAIYP